MKLYTLPVRPSIPAQSFGVVLDGRRYRVSLDWIGRIGRWSIDLVREGGEPVFLGRILATGADLLRQFQAQTDVPVGVLVLVDRSGASREATLDTLGRPDGHSLVFVAEIPAPGEGATVGGASVAEG